MLRAGAVLAFALAGSDETSSAPLDVSPSTVDLGTVSVGDARELTVTAVNSTAESVIVSDVRLEPSHAALSLVGDTCSGAELPVAGSCTVTVRFEPVGETVVATELELSTDRGSAEIPVSGHAEHAAQGTEPEASEADVDDTAPTGTEPAAGGAEPSGADPPVLATEPGGESGPPPTSGRDDTPSAGPSRPDLDDCEQRVRRLGLNASFVPEVTMTEGTTETVGLALAIGGTPLDRPPGAGTSPTTIVTFESDGCVVTAQLVGNGFEIAPPEPIEQSFVRRDHLEWSWQVTPIRPGDLELQAQVTPWLVTADGTRHAGASSTYYADIAVTARPKPERSVGYRLNEAVGSPVGASVVGVLLAGISATGLVGAVRKRRARRGATPG
jgi:hypothetical protein